jgi:acyl-coenzyme A synthetase/AMP-(fatty) acid ligase
MRGYLHGGHSGTKLINNPFATTGDPAKTAVRTGDFGYVDEEGFLFVRGRKDEMIKIQDNRVYPDEIAAQAVLVGGVCGAEVVGFQTPEGVSKLAAFLRVDKSSPQTLAGIRAELRKKLPSYMVPSLIEMCEAYPKTSNGKTDRKGLSRLASEIAFTIDDRSSGEV